MSIYPFHDPNATEDAELEAEFLREIEQLSLQCAYIREHIYPGLKAGRQIECREWLRTAENCLNLAAQTLQAELWSEEVLLYLHQVRCLIYFMHSGYFTRLD